MTELAYVLSLELRFYRFDSCYAHLDKIRGSSPFAWPHAGSSKVRTGPQEDKLARAARHLC